MTSPLSLPEHYVQRTIENMLPGDIVYPKVEDLLCVDSKTLEPHIDKLCPITPKDIKPQRFADRCGVMRVAGTTLGKDGAYLIDIRHLDEYSIEQATLTPNPDDSYDVKEEMSEDLKNLITPLGYIALEADSKTELIICNNQLIRPELMYLAEYTDQLANSALRKIICRLQLKRNAGGKILLKLGSPKPAATKRR